jgi:hypothetical protein
MREERKPATVRSVIPFSIFRLRLQFLNISSTDIKCLVSEAILDGGNTMAHDIRDVLAGKRIDVEVAGTLALRWLNAFSIRIPQEI